MHFKDEDFQTESIDTNLSRKERPVGELKKRKLLSHAVPSIFPNLPQHYNKEVPKVRSESTSTASRFQKQYEDNELANEEFLAADKITSLKELVEKLNSDLPEIF